MKKFIASLALLAVLAVSVFPAPLRAEPGPSAADPTKDSRAIAAQDDFGCLTGTGAGADKTLAYCVSNFVYFVMVGVGAWAATVAAYIFDYAVQISLNSGAYALDFISKGWGVVRDLANMSFLFILIYIGFKIMFQAETAGTIRMLTWVVVAALLINFSFLLTRVMVDAGNIVAVQFYNAIQAPSIQESAASGQVASTISNVAVNSGAKPGYTKDLTAAIMTALNVQSLSNTDLFKKFVQNPSNSSMYILVVLSVIYIMTGLALFIVAASFLFVGIKFVLRVVVLWFLIIGSPLAFIAAIFRGAEGGSKWFNMWLQYTLKFSFYPAIFLGMFWIQTIFMNEMAAGALVNSIVNSAGGTDLRSIATAIANVGVRLGFIVATLWLSLHVADWMVKEMSQVVGIAGNIAGKFGGLARFGGRGVAFAGGLATAPLRPIGRAVQAGVQSQANAATRTGVNPNLWRGVNWALGGVNVSRRSVTQQAQQPSQPAQPRTPVLSPLGNGQLQQQAQPGQPVLNPISQWGLGRGQAVIRQNQQAQTQTATPQASSTQPRTTRPTQAPGTTPSANTSATTGSTPVVMNSSAQKVIENLRAGAQRSYREQNMLHSEPVRGAQAFISSHENDNPEHGARVEKLKEQGDEIKRMIKEQGKKLAEVAQTTLVAGTVAVSSPDMSKLNRQATEPIGESVAAAREEIQGLNNTVRAFANKLSTNQQPPTRVVIQPQQPAPSSTAPSAPMPPKQQSGSEIEDIFRKAA